MPMAVEAIGVHDQLYKRWAVERTEEIRSFHDHQHPVLSISAATFPLTLCILKSKDLGTRRLPMATVPASDSRKGISHERGLIGFEEAMEKLSRDDRFRATVYAMNTLLVQKGVYSPEEFEFQFRQFAQKQLK
jgi:hypothetical protein